MKVVFSTPALNALESIGDFIAQDAPLRAVAFIRLLRKKARALGATPYAFPLVPGYEHCGVRRRPYGAYLIFYRVEDTRVTILHITHAAQDWERLLQP